MPSEGDECHALLNDHDTLPAADHAEIAGYSTDGREASDSVCGCTLLALRSLVLAPAVAGGDGEGNQDGRQGVARSAAHAMMRLLSAR